MLNVTKYKKLIGYVSDRVSIKEKLISGLGGIVGIFCTLYITGLVLPDVSWTLIVPSFGATAVLLFAIPHGPLSQPWNLAAGHIFSAIVGVSCAILIPYEPLAAACAVGIAISVQYFLNCLHPPGGATALVAVVGGQSVVDLGYMFVITPVLMNVVIILIIAIIFNYPMEKRRYPVSLKTKAAIPMPKLNTGDKCGDCNALNHANIVVALSELDTYVDISEEDLLRIYDIATKDL